MPDWIEWIVLVPMAEEGGVREICGKLGGPERERLGGGTQPGGDGGAEELAIAADGGERERGAEIDDDARRAEGRIRRDGVGDQVRPDLGGIVGPDRQPGADPRRNDERVVAGNAAERFRDGAGQGRHDAAQHHLADLAAVDSGVREKAAKQQGVFVAHFFGDGLNAPVVEPPAVAMDSENDVGVPCIDGEDHPLPPFAGV